MYEKRVRQWPDDFINKVICGDCLEVMKEMPDGVIDMCLTSPPYWGLRDYGVEQIFGGDSDCEHEWYVETMPHPMDRKGATGNLGNSRSLDMAQGNISRSECLLCSAWKGQLGLEPTPELYIEHMTAVFSEVKRVLKDEGTLWLNMGDTYNMSGYKSSRGKECVDSPGHSVASLQPKCLCMIPERLAWSLIQDGWILRNKIIWYKPNGMPSSVRDRFSNKWEYVFLFSKSRQYYFDLDTVREPHAESTIERYESGYWGNRRRGYIGGVKDNIDTFMNNPDRKEAAIELGKNPGDHWEIPTQPFPEAHFAVFPEKLCDKPIKAGCPEGGTVLDPFGGAGTVGKVANYMRRNFMGIEINPDYCKIAEERLAQGVL